MKQIPKINDTRWCSQLRCIKRLKEIPLDKLNEIGSLFKKIIKFNSKDYQAIKDLVLILEPFDEVTIRIQGDKYSTISQIMPSLAALLDHLIHCESNVNECKSKKF
jgi:hypothetical protein